MQREKVKFYVSQESFGVHACMVLMVLSAAFRLVGCWGLWNDSVYAATQIVLPVISALLFAALIRLLGKKALWMSFIPLALGVVFFIVKALGFDSLLHTVLCILLYLAVFALYFCTVFGIIKTKWILVTLFSLPFLYHVFVIDLPALSNTDEPVSFASGMQEMSVLCIMFGMLFLSLAMKKQITEKEIVLPKMKPPKIIRKPEAPADTGMGKVEAEAEQSTVAAENENGEDVKEENA